MRSKAVSQIVTFWAMLACAMALAGFAPGGARAGQAQSPAATTKTGKTLAPSRLADPGYLLGPGDQISIWALGAEELSDKPVRLDTSGYIDLPLLGRIHAAGLTVDQLKAQLIERLKKDVKDPQVSISITDFQSQPVSVIGAVNRPGIVQVQGRKTLIEVLSMAEGIRQDGGASVRITRLLEYGRLPLAGAKDDWAGKYSMADVNLKSVLDGENPEANLVIRPHDVVSVSRAETVYVIGEVKKSGGFVLGERQSVSILQALSMAEGLTPRASPRKSKILRAEENGAQRTEIAVDVSRILAGKAPDVALRPDDILFVPDNKARNAVLRAAETAINVGSGIAIWRVGLPR